MARDPSMRMSDTDRERVVEALREHMTEGRLTMDEFQERVEAAYKARTFADADTLLRDLPIDLGTLSRTSASPAPAERASEAPVVDELVAQKSLEGALRRRRQAVFRTWAGLGALLIGIWAITSIASGKVHYFWPIWPVGITGLLLVARLIAGSGEPSDRQRERWERRLVRHQARLARHEARIAHYRRMSWRD